MKKLIWGKTLFEAYKYLGRVINSLDNLVIESSAHSYSMGLSDDSTLHKVEAVIDLIERKKRLALVKFIIEDSLKSMPKRDAKILARFYIDKVDTQKIADEMGMNRRAVYRAIDANLSTCMDYIVSIGYGYNEMKKLLENEMWFVGIFNNNVQKYKAKAPNIEPMPIPKVSGLGKLIGSVYGRA